MGMCGFSIKLRHCVLSATHHLLLFLNSRFDQGETVYQPFVRRADGRLINGSLKGLSRRPKANLRYSRGT